MARFQGRWSWGWGLIGVSALALVLAGAVRPSPARQEIAAGAAASTVDAQEERLQAVEDIELLEAYVKAKQSQIRQSDLRLLLSKYYRDDAKKKQAAGYLGATAVTERELQVAEAETDRGFRLAELKDFEIRLLRARRRLAGLPKPE